MTAPSVMRRTVPASWLRAEIFTTLLLSWGGWAFGPGGMLLPDDCETGVQDLLLPPQPRVAAGQDVRVGQQRDRQVGHGVDEDLTAARTRMAERRERRQLREHGRRVLGLEREAEAPRDARVQREAVEERVLPGCTARLDARHRTDRGVGEGARAARREVPQERDHVAEAAHRRERRMGQR